MQLDFIHLNFLTFSEDPGCYLNMQSVGDGTGRSGVYEQLNRTEWLGMIIQQEITCIWLSHADFPGLSFEWSEARKSQYLCRFSWGFWPLLLKNTCSKLIQRLVSRNLKHMVNFEHMSSSVDITIKPLCTYFVRLGALPWEDSIEEEHSNCSLMNLFLAMCLYYCMFIIPKPSNQRTCDHISQDRSQFRLRQFWTSLACRRYASIIYSCLHCQCIDEHQTLHDYLITSKSLSP